MVSTYEISATAKINLYLKVCGTMPNGYHKLDTLMQEIDLCDELTVTVDDGRDQGIYTTCGDTASIPNDKNLCYKAASRFFSALKNKGIIVKMPFIEIKINKNIPSEAGLGGGSSDAAAVILALSEFYGNPFTDEELNTIAANTGADTPFFLYGGSCICEGFGEVISPVDPISGIPLILIKPRGGVSTPGCFKAFDKAGKNTYDASKYDVIKKELSAGKSFFEVLNDNRDLFVDDLEDFAANSVKDVKRARKMLEDEGASFVSMTGSGSCVFGLFEDETKRDLALGKISEDQAFRRSGMRIYSCKTV